MLIFIPKIQYYINKQTYLKEIVQVKKINIKPCHLGIIGIL